MESAADEFCGIFAFWERFSWTLLDDLRPTLKIRVVKRDLSCSVLQAKLKAKQSPRRCLYQHLWYFHPLYQRGTSTDPLAVSTRFISDIWIQYIWEHFSTSGSFSCNPRCTKEIYACVQPNMYSTYDTWCMRHAWRRRKSPQWWDSFYRSLFFYVFVFKVFVFLGLRFSRSSFSSLLIFVLKTCTYPKISFPRISLSSQSCFRKTQLER